MSKYTRLNKINHYHDSGSISSSQQQANNGSATCSKTRRTTGSAQILSPNSSKQPGEEDEPASDEGLLLGSSASSEHPSPSSRRTKNNSKMATSNNRNSKKPGKLALKQTNNASSSSSSSSSVVMKLIAQSMLIALLLLALTVHEVRSLNCYHCSSEDNPGCDEAFNGKANFTETDCEKHIGQPAKVCRKIVQFIDGRRPVTIRSCGFIDEHESEKKPMCYKRSGTFAIMMESCNCYTDNCNHSASLVPNQSVLSILSILGVAISYLIINNARTTSGGATR